LRSQARRHRRRRHRPRRIHRAESVARGSQGDEAMSRKLPKFVQGWVDREGRAHHYFRRAGYPRVRLRGLPWSPAFMQAYEQAMAAAPPPIGAAKTKPGSLSATLVAYYSSQSFRRLSAGTQTLWRQILERWREADGDKPIAVLPKEFIVRRLDGMKPHAA